MISGILFQGKLNVVEQYLTQEGFFDKSHRASPEDTIADLGISMAAHKDHRQSRVAGIEFLLEFKTAHARHTHIKQKTPRTPGIIDIQEVFSPMIGLYPETGQVQKKTQSLTDGLIVIDNKDSRLAVGIHNMTQSSLIQQNSI